MNFRYWIGLAAIMCMSCPTQAGTGSAHDAPLLTLAIVVFLLLIAAILQGVDYLKKNGLAMIEQAQKFTFNLFDKLKNIFDHINSRYLQIEPTSISRPH